MAWKMLGDKPFSTQYITGNGYYNLKDIKVDSIVLHSVGVGSPRTTQQWRDAWNKSTKNSVSAVVGPTEGIIMLPTFDKTGYARKCAGCGSGSKGSYNSSAVQVEMQEYKGIKYTGGANFTVDNMQEAVKYQLEVLDTAIQWMANICIYFNLNPLKPGVLVSHHEAHAKYEKASNHGDCDHLFNQLPNMKMTMDKVRQLVTERVKQYKEELEDENMTQEKFNEMLKVALSNLNADKTQANWQKEALDYCKANGLMSGIDTTGYMAPNGIVNRSQLAIVAMNLDKKIKK